MRCGPGQSTSVNGSRVNGQGIAYESHPHPTDHCSCIGPSPTRRNCGCRRAVPASMNFLMLNLFGVRGFDNRRRHDLWLLDGLLLFEAVGSSVPEPPSKTVRPLPVAPCGTAPYPRQAGVRRYRFGRELQVALGHCVFDASVPGRDRALGDPPRARSSVKYAQPRRLISIAQRDPAPTALRSP